MPTRWLPRFIPRAEHHPTTTVVRSDSISLRWLGTAGHAISTRTTTVLLDPFLSRPSLGRTALRPLRVRPERWWRWLPPKVDAIFVGHSHYDHLLDAPAIARRTGALLVGSRTTATIARAQGVPESQLRVVPPEGLELEVGDVRACFVPSLHGRLVAGRVPFPGEVVDPQARPSRFYHYKMGGAFGILVEARGTRFYHNGSADLVDAELQALQADVLLVGLAGRYATRDYLRRLIRLLGPRVIVPTHHDQFFAPLEGGVRLLPGIALDGFVRESIDFAPSSRIFTPTYDDELRLPEGGDPRDALFVPWG